MKYNSYSKYWAMKCRYQDQYSASLVSIQGVIIYNRWVMEQRDKALEQSKDNRMVFEDFTCT